MENLTLTKSLALSTAQAVNNQGEHGAIVRGLKASIHEALQRPPVKELVNQGASIERISEVLAVLITKYANMLSVGGNLKAGQSKEFASMLLSEYPYCSLDDFNIMLYRGVTSHYGEIRRFDIAVLFEWMKGYMIEYWEIAERGIKRETKAKDEEVIINPETQKMIDEYQGTLAATKSNWWQMVGEREAKTEGKERPAKKKASSYIPNPENVIVSELKLKYCHQCTNLLTGEILEGEPSFDEWLKMQP